MKEQDRKLTIAIECGETTCASEPGKFCNQVRVLRFGTKFTCALFGSELVDGDGVPSGPGWLQRLPECLDAGHDRS